VLRNQAMNKDNRDLSVLLRDIDYFTEAPKVTWTSPKRLDNGALTFGYPVYHEAVDRLTDGFYTGGFFDFDYARRLNELNLNGPDDGLRYIPKAPIEDVLTILSAIIRSERFCEGEIAEAIESGVIGSALLRIKELTD